MNRSERTGISPDAGGIDVDAIEERRRRRTRRRLTAWGGLLVLGLALGAIYATGFAVTGGATGTATDPAPNTHSPPDPEDGSELAPLVTQPDASLTFTWSGRWGDIASAALYKLDLDGESGDFFSEVVLVEPPTKFSDLQIQFRIADVGTNGTCDAAAIDGATTTNDWRVMFLEYDDAQVTFSGMSGATTGLPGGTTYCIGVSNYGPNPDSGKDTGGTFIRKSETGSTFSGTYPEFIGTLNRMP